MDHHGIERLMNLLNKMMRATGERKSTESDLMKIENRIQNLLREDSKIKRKMELTQRLGEKLQKIKEEKTEEELEKEHYLAFQEHQKYQNRAKIASIREQISQNIKEQKSRVLLQNKHR
jgi:hypothetical protein